jgi:hypothetical protein
MRYILKEMMSYKEFCKENNLSHSAKESQDKFKIYADSVDIKNRPDYDEIYKAAQEEKSKRSNKK